MKGRKWILGASDPEMEYIQKLLDDAGEEYIIAMKDGKRVSPSEAYDADPVNIEDNTKVFLVECSPSNIHGFNNVKKIDHHKEGDYGYGEKSESFLNASSVGQVFANLYVLKLLDSDIDVVDLPTYAGPGDATALAYFKDFPLEDDEEDDRGYNINIIETKHDDWVLRGESYTGFGDERSYFEVPVPDELIMVAAADHCLGHAYKGRCPGVNPDELMKWRVKSRAKFQGRSTDEILSDIERARVLLRDAPVMLSIRDCYAYGVLHEDALDGKPYDELDPILDLRDVRIPELPEAAAREGIAYCASVKERDGREKVVIGTATPEQVRAWMLWAEVQGYTNIYGVPERGYAGAYISGNNNMDNQCFDFFKLLQDKSAVVRRSLALNADIPASCACDIFTKLSKDKDADVRIGVAANPKIPEQYACEILINLSKDNDIAVRKAVERNPLWEKCKDAK